MGVFGHEAAFRLGVFLSVLVLLAVWEFLAPRRGLVARKPRRWLSNLALAGLNTLVLRLLLPLGVVGMAMVAQAHGWGLLNRVPLSSGLSLVLAAVALDFLIYLQHVLFHAVPVLWRVHRVHHADLDCDVSTGVRFHTLEMLLSMGIKVAAVILLGAPALAVVIFETLLNATSLFGHSNVCLPCWLDRALRFVVVTPDMHRVHHSASFAETNSNFGFNLPWWDYLLGTYHAQPAQGHQGMTIGLSQFRDERVEQLHGMLLLPFRRRDTSGNGSREPASKEPSPAGPIKNAVHGGSAM